MPLSDKSAFNLLNGKRIELNDMRELSKDARDVVQLDQQSVGRLSRMDALQGQAMALAAQHRRSLELDRIEKAFKRLESGDFGYCIQCDGEIALKRLEIDPAASLCIHCAQASET
ncbi:MAG: TraR/DksA family transcriptional regulator [Cohaesibacter sp.]|jgi:DnaK suppressor protein|nr:TraR/DksA family transcriptional regulator [Cohaesibacter sp.]